MKMKHYGLKMSKNKLSILFINKIIIYIIRLAEIVENFLLYVDDELNTP